MAKLRYRKTCDSLNTLQTPEVPGTSSLSLNELFHSILVYGKNWEDRNDLLPLISESLPATERIQMFSAC